MKTFLLLKRKMMRDCIRLLLTAFSILISLTSNSQTERDRKIPINFLKEDFNSLRSTLESTQLGLYLYTSKDSLDQVFEKINSSLNEPMTSVEFYRKIAPLNKILRNLHTVLWQSATYEKGIETDLPRFPLVVPAQQMYQGNVYVLMNGYSVSATGEFIGHLKNIHRAVFIGEESGGNPVVFTGGQALHIELPNTHVTGVIPLHLNEMNVRLKNTGHGVIPDYEIKPDIADILQGKDKEMEFALKLIKERR